MSDKKCKDSEERSNKSASEDSEVTNKLEAIAINSDEDGDEVDLIFDEEDIGGRLKDCSSSLLGKIFTCKPVNLNGLMSTMFTVWNSPEEFNVEEIGDRIYQFFFKHEEDMNRILKGSPWFFNNQLLILSNWDPSVGLGSANFSTTPLWIQIWNWPVIYLTESIIRKMSQKLGPIQEVKIPPKASIDGKFARLKIDWDVSKPLLKELRIKFPKEGPTMIRLRYERLPLMCFYCGIIGHDEHSCPEKMADLADGIKRSCMFDSGLRAKSLNELFSPRNYRLEAAEIAKSYQRPCSPVKTRLALTEKTPASGKSGCTDSKVGGDLGGNSNSISRPKEVVSGVNEDVPEKEKVGEIITGVETALEEEITRGIKCFEAFKIRDDFRTGQAGLGLLEVPVVQVQELNPNIASCLVGCAKNAVHNPAPFVSPNRGQVDLTNTDVEQETASHDKVLGGGKDLSTSSKQADEAKKDEAHDKAENTSEQVRSPSRNLEAGCRKWKRKARWVAAQKRGEVNTGQICRKPQKKREADMEIDENTPSSPMQGKRMKGLVLDDLTNTLWVEEASPKWPSGAQ